MKVTIRHLGKIAKATLDLRPLTLLVGENNTNKTWTAYAIYALLRGLTRRGVGRATVLPQITDKKLRARIRELAQDTAQKLGGAALPGTKTIELTRELLLEAVSDPLRLSLGPRQLAAVLALPLDGLKGASVSLEVPRPDLERGCRRRQAPRPGLQAYPPPSACPGRLPVGTTLPLLRSDGASGLRERAAHH